jgi:transcriptional regulator with XRE-family HTH domain
VGTLVPSQIRALRLNSEMPRQSDLARAAGMQQSRISMVETPGANPTLSTLSNIAAALNVGLVVQFVPFSAMLAWENNFGQHEFDVTRLDNDIAFLNPQAAVLEQQVPAEGMSTSRQFSVNWARFVTSSAFEARFTVDSSAGRGEFLVGAYGQFRTILERETVPDTPPRLPQPMINAHPGDLAAGAQLGDIQ